MAVIIIQGTNPDITFNLTQAGIPTSSLTAVEMTISDCSAVKIKKTAATYHDTYKVTFSLTQTETLALDPGDYRVQFRCKATVSGSEKVMATKLMQIRIDRLASGTSL